MMVYVEDGGVCVCGGCVCVGCVCVCGVCVCVLFVCVWVVIEALLSSRLPPSLLYELHLLGAIMESNHSPSITIYINIKKTYGRRFTVCMTPSSISSPGSSLPAVYHTSAVVVFLVIMQLTFSESACSSSR